MIKKMTSVQELLRSLMTEDSGQDLIDYALLAACVGLAIGAAAKNLSNSTKTAFNAIGNSLTNAVS